MTPATALEITVARHAERLDDQEGALRRVERSVEKILWTAITTLVTAVGGLIVMIFKLHG